MDRTKKSIRLKYFLKTGLQQRFLRENILLVIFVVLFIAISVYQLSMNILGPNLEGIYPSGLLKEIYMNYSNALVVRLLFIISAVVIVTFLITHRVAGPAYHIERDLAAMADGDLTKRVYLRKYDELKMIATNLNKMVDRVSQSLDFIKKDLETMEKLSEELKHGEFDQSKRDDLSEKIAIALKGIRDALSQFRIK